jgi:hypothetical protein
MGGRRERMEEERVVFILRVRFRGGGDDLMGLHGVGWAGVVVLAVRARKDTRRGFSLSCVPI